jgi:phosphoglycolate phosphatase-like HAD superfamily hydrolase
MDASEEYEAQPRALLFDWDNTLVDNWDVITEAMNAVYDAFGMARWTVGDAKSRIRESMRDAFPKAFGDRAKEAGRIFSDYFAAHHLDGLQEMPGDMRCARNAGCLPVLLRREPPGPGEFDADPPAIHLRDCAGLTARLRALGVLPTPNM